MNECKDCVAYKIHHNQVDNETCSHCGNKTLTWKQNDFGTFRLECSSCDSHIYVDLNTPCEKNHSFFQQNDVDAESAREKYPYYQKCKYPYSRMRMYL